MVDIQPEIQKLENVIPNLISYEDVKEGNIGLERIYELVDCKSRMVEKVYLGKLSNGNELHLICDEEGTFGQWSRGIKMTDENGYQHSLLGNGIFIKSVGADMVGWDTQEEMADDVRKYVNSIKIFDVV